MDAIAPQQERAPAGSTRMRTPASAVHTASGAATPKVCSKSAPGARVQAVTGGVSRGRPLLHGAGCSACGVSSGRIERRNIELRSDSLTD